MSVGVLRSADLVGAAAQTADYKSVQTLDEASGWSKESFAREQIRGLVRQVFFSSASHPVRQIVFCAAESGGDIGGICWRVAEVLALDVTGTVAMVKSDVIGDQQTLQADQAEIENKKIAGAGTTTWRESAIRMKKNLWLLPQIRLVGDDAGSRLSFRLCEVRQEFEYSIVQGPPAGESSEAAALGQSADGIVLVLAAHVTRRATALKIKETLAAAQVRLLGTVLSERRFPIPEGIYRRL